MADWDQMKYWKFSNWKNRKQNILKHISYILERLPRESKTLLSLLQELKIIFRKDLSINLSLKKERDVNSNKTSDFNCYPLSKEHVLHVFLKPNHFR